MLLPSWGVIVEGQWLHRHAAKKCENGFGTGKFGQLQCKPWEYRFFFFRFFFQTCLRIILYESVWSKTQNSFVTFLANRQAKKHSMLPNVPFYNRFPFQINVKSKLFNMLSNSVLTTKPNPFFKFISLIRPKPRKNFSTSLSLASLGSRPRNTLGALSLLMIFVIICIKRKDTTSTARWWTNGGEQECYPMRPYYLERMTCCIIKACDRGLRDKKKLLQKVVDCLCGKIYFIMMMENIKIC